MVFGKLFGKHNFSYFISPKKTLEGLFGQFFGVFVSLAVIKIMVLLFGFNDFGFTLFDIFLIGMVIIPITILGDLMESILKRALTVKDSSSTGIIGSGLGGVLDKFDSFGVGFMIFPILIKFLRPDHYPY